jgi:opacity protein-like surface antigen
MCLAAHRLHALLGLSLFACWPMLVHAETSFTLKGGATKLWDNTQTVNGASRDFDDTSTSTFAIAWEHRRRNGAAFGMEYLSYRNDFTPPASPDTGVARTQVLQFVAHKYFDRAPVVHPFFGMGIGTSQTTVSYDTPSSYTKYDWSLALQLNGGVEFRIDPNFAFSAEIKGLFFDVDSNHYNPSSTGLFLGATVLF